MGAYAYVHAEQDIVLWAHAQVLTDGVQIRADVLAHDVGSARCGREKARKNGP